MKEFEQGMIKKISDYCKGSPSFVDESLMAATSTILGAKGSHGFNALEAIFTMQTGLNDLIFHKNEIKASDGIPLSVERLKHLASSQDPKALSDSIEWLRRFTKALEDETRELKDELPWKWWSKDSANMQNIKVEIVDHLFFVICLAQAAGMDSEELFDLYRQKAIVNLERQFKGYSKASKTEEDNEQIGA